MRACVRACVCVCVCVCDEGGRQVEYKQRNTASLIHLDTKYPDPHMHTVHIGNNFTVFAVDSISTTEIKLTNNYCNTIQLNIYIYLHYVYICIA